MQGSPTRGELGSETGQPRDEDLASFGTAATLERRRLIVGGGVAAVAAAVGLVLGGVTAGVGRLVGRSSGEEPKNVSLPGGASQPSPSTSTSAGGPPPSNPPGRVVGPARDVPVGGSASFQDPGSGDPALVLQPHAGEFHAFDAVCPHAGCTVGYAESVGAIVCPCHGSQFNATTGAVEVGPATRGLATIRIAEGQDGRLYVQD